VSEDTRQAKEILETLALWITGAPQIDMVARQIRAAVEGMEEVQRKHDQLEHLLISAHQYSQRGALLRVDLTGDSRMPFQLRVMRYE
jgi:hypothetical protein